MSAREQERQHWGLVERISDMLDGETLDDSAWACAEAIAFCLSELPDDEQREAKLSALVGFIRERCRPERDQRRA